MSDFKDIAEAMVKEGGAIQVKNEEELLSQATRLLSDVGLGADLGARNKALVERNSGVTAKIAEDILERLRRA